MNPFLFSITDEMQRPLLGNRGATLQTLSQGNFLILPTFVLSADAYELFSQENRLVSSIQSILRTPEANSKEKSKLIHNAIFSSVFPVSLFEGIQSSYVFSKPATFWFLSPSSNLVDLIPRCLEESLVIGGVKKHDTLVDLIQKSWASFWSESTVECCVKNDVDPSRIKIAVLIQKKVDLTCSGLLWTKDPHSDETNEIFIEYGRGFPQRGRGGKSGLYFCTVNKETRKIHSERHPEKRFFMDDEIYRLCDLSRRLEDYGGLPQKIEWIYDSENFYLLYARPLEHYERVTRFSQDQLWVRAYSKELFPTSLLPLSMDIASAVLPSGLFPKSCFSKQKDSEESSTLFRWVDGNNYLSLNGFYEIFFDLPFMNKTILEKVFGVTLPPNESEALERKRFLTRLSPFIFLLRILGFWPRGGISFKRVSELSAIKSQRFEDLLAWINQCFCGYHQMVKNRIGAFAVIYHVLDRGLTSSVETNLQEFLIRPQAGRLARIGLRLWELAEDIKTNGVIRGVLTTEYDRALMEAKLAELESGKEFLAHWQEFLTDQGSFCPNFFELSLPRWGEDPDVPVRCLQKFVSGRMAGHFEKSSFELKRKRQEDFLKLLDGLNYHDQWLLRNALEAFFQFEEMREDLYYKLMEGFGELRKVFLKEAQGFVSQGILDDKNDIFFLKMSEVMALPQAKNQPQDYKALIRKRKDEFFSVVSKPVPDMLLEKEEFSFDTPQDSLHGISVSAGKAEGIACVLRGASPIDSIQEGKILIIAEPQARDLPLFLLSKAVVSQGGGFLSDAACFLRDLGIPAIFHVPDALKKIKDGQEIRVNATLGTISIGKKEETFYNK